MKYQKYNCDGYSIHTIKTNRFRNCHLEIIFRDNIVKSNITKRSMLTDLLTSSSKKYPNRKSLDIELENLYNSFFYGITSRVGGMIATSFCFDFLNPKYCTDITLEEFIAFPIEIIKNPNIINNEFDINNFNIVKNSMINEIKSIKDNSKKFALLDTLKEMDNNSPISYQTSGYLEDLDKITNQNIIKYYQDMLENNYCDIFITGDLNMKDVVKTIKKHLEINSIKKYSIDLIVSPNIRKKINKTFKNENYKQANLVIGCNLVNMNKFERLCVINVLNTILGGNSLDTKLATYLRTDNSLCYTVSSLIQKYDNILLIHAGIDDKKYDLAVKLIKKALNELQKGIISKQELENAKKLCITSLKSIMDNESALVNSYLFHDINNLPLLEDRIEKFKKVRIEDVTALAKKIKINTINFVYKGSEK